jgi:hypothetical protein
MDVLEYIKKMQEMYGDDVITTADKINRPEPKREVQEIELFNKFNRRNPKADGGQLVAPSVDGSRPGYQGPEKFPIPKGYITANQLAEELGISKETLKKYRLKNLPVDKYPLKGFIDKTFKPFKGKSSATGTATYYLKPTEEMLENYNNFKNRTTISRDLLNDVKKLHNSKLIKNLVKSKNKTLPTLEEIVKILDKDVKSHGRAANAMATLSKMYSGEEYKLLKLPKNEETGKFIFKALRQGGRFDPYKAAFYNLAIKEIDKTLGNEVGTLKNFKRYFKDNLNKYLGKGHGVSLNEVASISGMVSNDMAPYGAFVDLTNSKINKGLLANFQGTLTNALTEIDKLKGREKVEAIKAFNKTHIPNFKKQIAAKYGNKLANSIRFTEIVPGARLTDTYKAEDLARYKTQGIDLESLAKKKGYYLDVKGARPYTEFLDNKKLTKAGKINAMETLIKSLCPNKASGGRIGYQNAGAVTGTLQCGINQFNKNMKTGNANSALMRRILANGGNILKSVGKQLNPAELLRLRNLIGPQALGFFAAFEAGDITDDVLRKNIPVNEALAKNWLTKTFLPYREQGARAKNLLQSGKLTTDAQKVYALDLMKLDQAIIKQEQVEQMKLDQGLGYGKDESGITNEMIDAAEKDLERRVNAIGDPVSTEGSAIGQEYQTLEDEMIASRLDKFKLPFQSDKGTRLVNKLAKPPGRRVGPGTAKREMKIDFSLPTYDRMETPTDQDILNTYRQYGIISPTEFKTGVLQPGEGTLIRMMQGGQGLYGTQFATGGIVGDKSGPPPTKGPMSQGLRSLYNNGRKL